MHSLTEMQGKPRWSPHGRKRGCSGGEGRPVTGHGGQSPGGPWRSVWREGAGSEAEGGPFAHKQERRAHQGWPRKATVASSRDFRLLLVAATVTAEKSGVPVCREAAASPAPSPVLCGARRCVACPDPGRESRILDQSPFRPQLSHLSNGDVMGLWEEERRFNREGPSTVLAPR